jgi:hypothetical protein
MRALIQHNFTSGLGDGIVAVFEYIETANNLKNQGYSVDLTLNIKNNVYLYEENFFDLFNKEIFTVFENIDVSSSPINENTYGELTKVYTLGSAPSGSHWWDLFVSNPNSFEYNWLSIYPYQNEKTPEDIKIFDKNVYEEFSKIKNDYGINKPYTSIYFRTLDLNDKSHLFAKYENLINSIIELNDVIFVCSNSAKIKKLIKDIGGDKIISYNIPYENNFGNHWNGTKMGLDSYDLFERTKYTVFDMLTLATSDKIYHITEWNRTSNFLIFSKINKVQITPCYEY